jgi:hypothetical protein
VYTDFSEKSAANQVRKPAVSDVPLTLSVPPVDTLKLKPDRMGTEFLESGRAF